MGAALVFAPPSFAEDVAQRVVHLLGTPLHLVRLEQPGHHCLDRRQWRAQVVRDGAQQRRPRCIDLGERFRLSRLSAEL